MSQKLRFFLFAANIVWSSAVLIKTDNPIVDTECGPVEGIKTSAYVFKGIPYAEPPVANLRWQPPVPKSKETKTCWKGTFKADTFGNTCTQRGLHDAKKIIGSEDCLYLNVWTPSIEKDGNLPVIVWIHGGNLNNFNGNWPSYCPSEELASNTSVVYVSMNYRLNAFGFMSLDILSEASKFKTSGNYGFMDQILALQWVKKNIKYFGGNPDLVTVYGHGSGGTSVMTLLASPLSSGLFHRAYMSSASPLLQKTSAEASKDNLIFLTNTGCSDIDCLISLSADDVIDAVPWDVYPYWAMTNQVDLPTYKLFHGAIATVDGYVLPMNPLDAWEGGTINDVPVMIGTTSEEIDYSPVSNDIASWTWENYTTNALEKLRMFPGLDIAEILKLYPLYIDTPEYQYTTMSSDMRITCPTNELAHQMQHSFKSSIYRYVCKARPKTPVNLYGFSFKARYGAHGWDNIAFFGNVKDFYTPSEDDEELIRSTRRELIHFATYGTPFTEVWKPFPESTALFDVVMGITDIYHKKQCSFWAATGLYAYAWVN